MGSRTGYFEWRDIKTTDPEAAKAFYTGLFGWTVNATEMEGMGPYEIFSNNGNQFGGVTPITAEEGVPSHWISYLTIEDFDNAIAKIPALGGNVLFGPMEIPTIGTWAVASDPSGAVFSPFNPTYPADPALESSDWAPIGGISWNELTSADVPAAKAFYSGIVGWTFDDMDMGGMTYSMIKSGERQDGGLTEKPADAPASAWLIYFVVESIEDSIAKIAELGGSTMTEIIEVPGIGRISVATDPTGAFFAIHEYAAH